MLTSLKIELMTEATLLQSLWAENSPRRHNLMRGRLLFMINKIKKKKLKSVLK